MDVPVTGELAARPRVIAGAALRSRDAAIVAAVLLVATIARLPALLGDGLWRDEANVYVQVTAPAFGEFFTRVTGTEWHPPLFFLLMYGWVRLAGTSELALKSVPFVFSVATVGLVYLIGKTIGSRTAGAVAALTYAVAPFTVLYSSEYLYPLASFTCTLVTLLVVRARARPPAVRDCAALAFAALLAVFSHYTALIDLPLLAGWALVSRVPLRRRFAIAGSLAAGMLPFGLWLPTFITQRRIGVPYSPPPSALHSAAVFLHGLLTAIPARPRPFEAAFVAFAIAALIMLERAQARERAGLAAGAVFVIALAVSAAANLAQARYVLPMYGLACVAVGCIAARAAALLAAADPLAWRRFGRIAALGMGIAFIGADLANAAAISRVPKSGLRALVHDSVSDESTLYVLAPDYLASTFAYYARDSAASFAGFVRWERPEVFRLADYAADWNRPDAVDRALEHIARAPAAITTIALVIDDSAHDSAQCPYGRVLTLLDRLRARYPLAARRSYPGRYEPVTVYRFRRTRL